ncbi:peptide transporter family 1-like [Macrobrachium nipponense]|uniref:peptide transporter family 1-like n=1 Tax=Macrobrachium nipponense TaxID=159736 RepID=UPI0030C8A205
MAEDRAQAKLPYPRSAFFVLVGYLLERFVYYGLFGGAVFYMQRMLGFTSSSASTVKAVMEGLIYLAPIAGAVLADTYLGKARTVLIMCCGYTIGAAIFTLSSVTPIMSTITAAKFTGIIGLLVLGICAGLMKAVYSSLGADQFKVPEQREEQKRYFYAFYWMINAGAFVGQFMTAQIRDSVQCFGDDCYFLPFAILVGFMVCSTVIFAAGRSRYIEAPPDTMLINAIKCAGYAIRKSWDKHDRKPVDHWLDRSKEKYDSKLIKDVKITCRVLLLFCTYPIFWALFYQTSTGMIFQAKRLDGLVGTYRIPPEMSSSINPLLILTLIPLFDLVIYPCFDRAAFLTTVTSRMIAGMCFAVSSFIVYAIVNVQVEQTLILPDHARIHIYNALPCEANIQLPNFNAVLETGGQVAVPDFLTTNAQEIKANIEPTCPTPDMSDVTVVTLGGHETTLLLSPVGAKSLPPTLEYIKSEDAEAKVRILTTTPDAENVTLKYDTLVQQFQVKDGMTLFQTISPQEYKVYLGEVEVGDSPIHQDGVYDVVLTETSLFVFPVTKPASVHMLWLIPQYLLLTIGEVLFSVSGMDFAYSEAPTAMKSVLQAANLFTITVGLWLFAGLTSLSSATGAFQHRASQEALLYAGLMAANTVIFVLLLRWYNRVPKDDGEEANTVEENEDKQPRAMAADNKAFVEDDAV